MRDELQSAIRATGQADEEASAAADLVEAQRAVVAQVQLDLSRLARSATAIDQLSPLEFVVCPRCMQSQAARAVEDDHCLVCLPPGPVEPDIDPAAVEETRTALQQQFQDAQHIQQSVEAPPQTPHKRPQQTTFVVTSRRRQLDAQTRDAVAPHFDAIADASSRVAVLKASIDASQTLLGDLGTEFGRLLTGWNLPWVTTAVIDPDTYLAVVNGQPFESLNASGGGIVRPRRTGC